MKIALLDPDSAQSISICGMLGAAGHDCSHFSNEKDYLAQFTPKAQDLLLIDWQVQKEQATAVTHLVRQQADAGFPILFLTGISCEEDILQGIASGASDYLLKPIRRRELLSRVQAALRRAYPDHSLGQQIRFGHYGFDALAERVQLAGKIIDVTSKEFALALLLFRNIDRPLSRAFLLESVWAREASVPSRSLDTHISRVRNKLELFPQNGLVLTPVYSFGYRLEQLQAHNTTQPAAAID